jgi:hypothetical protein
MACSLALSAAQQAAPPPPPPPVPAAAPAAVTYAVEAANRDPARFSLTIDLVGHAVYTAEDPPATPADADSAPAPPYRADFDVAPATRDRVFAAALALDHFHGDFEFRKHRIADTGKKTFTYRDGREQSSTVFHWSENKQLEELADLFESIALTQSLARRLVFLRRYDRLGIDAVLKRMEELARANYLSELQSIAPTLRQIAADPSVMHVARERANRLLDQIAAAAAPAPSSR